MPVPAGGYSGDTLATVADLQELVGDIDTSRAQLLLEVATAVVQAAAGGQRILEVVDDTVTLYLDEYDGGLYLDLPQRPVTAVGAVQVGDTVVSDTTAQLSRGRLWRAEGWRSGSLPYYSQPSEVTVTYTHGYPEGDQRLQLARSATLMLAQASASAPAGVVREQIDDYSVQYAAMAGQLAASDLLTAQIRRQYGRPGRSVRLVAS